MSFEKFAQQAIKGYQDPTLQTAAIAKDASLMQGLSRVGTRDAMQALQAGVFFTAAIRATEGEDWRQRYYPAEGAKPAIEPAGALPAAKSDLGQKLDKFGLNGPKAPTPFG